MSIFIQSPQNQQFKWLKRLLLEHAFRQKQSRTILEGVHLTQDWQKNKPQDVEFIFAAESIQTDILEKFQYQNPNQPIPKIILMSDALWRELTPISPIHELLAVIYTHTNTNTNTHGLLDLKKPTSQTICMDILKKHQRILILENVQDVGNLGSIIRTAAAAGYDLIIQIGGAHAFHPKVLRAAMGGHLFIEMMSIHGTDTAILQNLLMNLTHQILVTDLAAENFIYQTKINPAHIWVMGNEGQGVVDSWRQLHQTTLVKIPQLQAVESLNVGHACAICLYESVRRNF